MKRFVFTIAVSLLLVGSVYAQGRLNAGGPSDPNDPLPGYTYSEKMSGLETSKGTEDFEDDIIWGRSITMAGELGEFTAYIHRAGVKINSDWGNRIAGGTWTLHVYKEGQLRGMLFGEFTDGIIQWFPDKSGNIAFETIEANLVITGGTGEFESKGGPQTHGVMRSFSDVNTKTFPLHVGSVSLFY